jgi:hypothetical protein
LARSNIYGALLQDFAPRPDIPLIYSTFKVISWYLQQRLNLRFALLAIAQNLILQNGPVQRITDHSAESQKLH